MTTWQDELRERELERQIAAGETPLDVLLMLAYAVAVWVVIIVAYWLWG